MARPPRSKCRTWSGACLRCPPRHRPTPRMPWPARYATPTEEKAWAACAKAVTGCGALLASHYGSQQRAESLMAAWITSYDAISSVEPIARKSGLDELLDLLDAHSVPKAVATSTRRERAQAKLARTNLLHRFDAL